VKLAVVIANLGGPDRLSAVRPFLLNLFSDPAIIRLPQPFRALVARMIAYRRAPTARVIYQRIGGGSPILKETLSQGEALERTIAKELAPGDQVRVFTAMRYWHPLVCEMANAVKAWNADKIVLLPLYPQFSTTTTQSFFDVWDDAIRRIGLTKPTARICCHPTDRDFIAAHVHLIRSAIAKLPADTSFRLLFSAHGLPKRVVEAGDPYQWQVEATAHAIVAALANPTLDWRICYQSRVGPLAWLEPSTEHEIKDAGAVHHAVIVVPIAFVSEHSETLVELDMDYAQLAAEAGITSYIRVPALGPNPSYIEGLAALIRAAKGQTGIHAGLGHRLCPSKCRACPIHVETSP
jgi:ferrochelatase